MRNPLPRTLSFKLIGKNNSTGEMESRRIILRKARTESKLHIVLKILAYCYFCASIGVAAEKGYWDFDHSCFTEVKDFLRLFNN